MINNDKLTSNIQLVKSIFIGFIISTLVFIFNNSNYPLITVELSLISLSFVLSTVYMLITTKHPQHAVFLLVISLTWVYFQEPFLKSEKVIYYGRNIPEDYYFEMAFYPCISIIMLYIGYYKFFTTPLKKTLTNKSYKLNLTKLKYLIQLFGILSILNSVFKILIPSLMSQLGNTIQVLNYSAAISVSLFILYHLRGGKSSFITILILFVGFIELMGIIISTLYAFIIIFVSGPFIAYFFEKRRIPVISIVIFFILTYPIYKTRFDYRYNLDIRDVTIPEKIIIGTGMLSDIYSNWSFQKNYDNNDIWRPDRFENLSFIGQCVYLHEITGKPFYHGKTFWWLPIAPIPRFLFPWKPENLMATKISFEYGLKGIDDKNSAFNFPMLVESYINFGFIGMIFFSLFQGIFLKLFLSKISFGIGDINLLILINSMTWFLHIEANITLVFGGLIQIYIFWWLLIKYIIPLFKKS